VLWSELITLHRRNHLCNLETNAGRLKEELLDLSRLFLIPSYVCVTYILSLRDINYDCLSLNEFICNVIMVTIIVNNNKHKHAVFLFV
jgi:hypothetical protein